MSAEVLAPSAEEIGDFVRRIGLEQIVAIPADRGAPPDGWPRGRDGHAYGSVALWVSNIPQAIAWAVDWNARGANLYWSPNLPSAGLAKKASKREIRSARFLYVDLDPAAGEAATVARDRILGALRDSGVPTPTILIFSGGGYQALWALSPTVPILGDEVAATEYERHNRHLESLLGADDCHNVDRVLRLPGTVNWPNKVKRDRGRVPTLAALVDLKPTCRYSIGQFPQALPLSVVRAHRAAINLATVRRVSANELEDTIADGALRALIVTGKDPHSALGDRSRELWKACSRLARLGLDDQTIFAIITDATYAISAHVLAQPDPPRAAARVIERTRDAVAKQVAEAEALRLTFESIRVGTVSP